tara:strand:- start:235 stop:1470 length:1236 start_codon:yes stop_codon:yes gene_type:complete
MNKYTLYNRNNKIYTRINRNKFLSLQTIIPQGCRLITSERRIEGNHLDVPKINSKLSEWDIFFQKLHHKNADEIVDLWRRQNHQVHENSDQNHDILVVFEKIYNMMYEGSILNNGKLISGVTLKTYVTVLHVLNSFNKPLNFKEIDEGKYTNLGERLKARQTLKKWFDEFILFSIELKYHPTTRRNQIKIIKSIINKACDVYGYIIKTPSKPPKLRTPVISLTPQQVETIHKNKPKDVELECVWYYTRFLLHSCMRISDAWEFIMPNTKGHVTYINRKTGSQSTFYLPEDVHEYIYKNPMASAVVKKTFRKQLVVLLKTYPELRKNKVVHDYDHTGKLVVEEKPIYKIITPHKLRSSGITWYLYLGYTEKQVREISGHINGSTAFYRYTDITDSKTREKHAREIDSMLKLN